MTFLTFKSNTMNNAHRPQSKYIYNQNELIMATKTKRKRQQRKRGNTQEECSDATIGPNFHLVKKPKPSNSISHFHGAGSSYHSPSCSFDNSSV